LGKEQVKRFSKLFNVQDTRKSDLLNLLAISWKLDE